MTQAQGPPANLDKSKSLPSVGAGLAPEAVTFHPTLGMTVEKDSSRNQLRPEAVESLYYLWRLTGERKYRDWGWAMFQAFQKHSRGKTGYHSIAVRHSCSTSFPCRFCIHVPSLQDEVHIDLHVIPACHGVCNFSALFFSLAIVFMVNSSGL